MNTKDVLKIIKQAKKAGLESIELEGLKLRFFPGDAEERVVLPVEPQRPLKQTELEIVEQAIEDLEEDLASLQIDDPVAFEDMIVERDIEFGREDEGANDR